MVEFDALAYYEKLIEAGFTEIQARVVAEGIKTQSESFQTAFNALAGSLPRDIATRGDLQETRLILEREIQEVRLEIQDTRLNLEKEIQEVRLEVEKVRGEIRATESRLKKWQVGIAVTILLIMAKGFNWLGF